MRVLRRAGGAAAALILLTLAVAASPATATEIHPSSIGAFGSDGTSGTTIGEMNQGQMLAFDQNTKHLYALGKTPPKIYGFDAPNDSTHTPLSGFPFGAPETGYRPAIAVDSSNGDIFMVSEESGLYGFNSTGELLPGPFPVRGAGEVTCGVAIDGESHVWVADNEHEVIREYNESGEYLQRLIKITTGAPCSIAFDKSNEDLFVGGWNGNVWKYTAASDYTEHVNLGNVYPRQIMVDSATHVLYIEQGFGNGIEARDENGNPIETFATGIPTGGNGQSSSIAINEADQTIYVSNPNTNQILVYPAAIAPDVTTEEPSGAATINGHVDPAGGGSVTGCYFEYKPYYFFNWESSTKVPCEPTIPPGYSSPTDVHADISGAIQYELEYEYRLVASNAQGKAVGHIQSVIKHHVSGLTTEPATNIGRNTATLNASFIGTGENTEYYFQWGPAQGGYPSSSSAPFGEDAGVTTGPTTMGFTVPEGELEPGTTYHYRVQARNAGGTSVAKEVQFTTLPAVFGVSTEAATNVTKESAELHGSFTGDGPDTSYYFEYGASVTYGKSTALVDAGTTVGPVTAEPAQLTELVSGKTYHFRFVAENSYGKTYGEDLTFTTLSKPVIVALSSSNVTATSADLHAVINDRNQETTYRFEYGSTLPYGSSAPTPEGELPASTENKAVTVHLSNLQSVVYHFRVVATSAIGETVSFDQTFNFYPESCPNETVRQQTGAGGLPDCRAYELVTPENAGNTLVYPGNVPFSSTATSPPRLAWDGAYGLVEGLGEESNNWGDLYVATRTSSGWQSKYVGLPASEVFLSGGPPWFFNSGYDLDIPDKMNVGVLTNPSLSDVVEWNDGRYGCIGEGVEEQCKVYGGGEGWYSSNAPYLVNTTTGKKVERWPTNVHAVPGGEHFIGETAASADLSHFVFNSNVAFAPGAEPGAVYDNNTETDTVSEVSFNEEGNPLHNAAPVEVSSDGSHILMTVGGARKAFRKTNGPGQLFMRVNDERTYDIAAGNAVEYVGMTPDGKKVYFTSAAQLTPEDTDTSVDLYMWSEESSAANHLTLISKGNNGTAGNSNSCDATWTQKCDAEPIFFSNNHGGGLGEGGGYTVAQAAAGGSPYSDSSIASGNGDIYFLSPEQLVGDNGATGEENLYDYREGQLQFVAALEPGKVSCVTVQETTCSDTDVARMNVSPDDSHMAFLTASKVTSYENAEHSEMYTYTPATGELQCVSCLPSGAPPTSDVTASHNGLFMTNDGRTFFDTSDALVPADTNEVEDVYEFVNGRPRLISSGTAAGNESFGLVGFGTRPGLIGVSADGTDVYFATFDVLVGQDRNGDAIKIYDARTGGGFPFNAPPPGCAAADECHGPSTSAPPPPSGGTAAELGNTGNMKPAKANSNKKRRAHRKRRHEKHAHPRRARQKRHGKRHRNG